MSAAFPWARSLRFRLTAWYTGALAVLLLGAALLLLLGAQRALRADTDAFLTAEAHRIGGMVSGEPGDAPDPGDLAEAVSARHQAPATRPPSFDTVYVRLIARRDRAVLAASPGLAPALAAALDRALPPAGPFAYAGPDEERLMRVLTEPLTVGRTPAWLQVAVPWDRNADMLERLGLLLALSVPGVLLAAALGGWVLVGRTLQPIQRIVAEAAHLDAEAMPEALLPAPAETDSEIGQLVVTLNGMTTRLRRAFDAQRRFAQAQQRFAADASHELRTPLTILRGEMELALGRPRRADDYRGLLTSSLEEIERMSRIVEGLSFLARMDARSLCAERRRERVSLADLGRGATEEFAERARAKRLGLSFGAAPAAGGEVAGDTDQLRQVARNLIDNALKYTPAGGCVRVSVTETDSGHTLEVRDTGVGIAAADLPHVFERFWRADSTLSAGGSGLGLAICAQIAHAHGGALTVESAPGAGSVFRLSLPPFSALEDSKPISDRPLS